MDVEPWYSESGAKGKSMRRILIGWLVVTALAARALGQGTILWDEVVNGPLAEDPGAPTFVGNLELGTNSVLGAAQFVRTGDGPGGTLHNDSLSFSVGQGRQVSMIFVQSDNPVLLWIGDPGFTSELAFVFSPASGTPMPQPGLGVVPSGSYGFYISDRQWDSPTSVANYRLDFVVQSIPEPSAFSFLLGALGVLRLWYWRKAGLRTGQVDRNGE